MDKLIDDLIKLAFAEDIGDGDHTTLCCIPETAMGKSQLIIKEDGVLAGVEMAKRIFHDFDPELKMTGNMLLSGLILILVCFASNFLLMEVYLNGILAHELKNHILLTALTWYLAGISGYLLVAWICLEPAWKRRILNLIIAVLLLRIFFLSPTPEAYNKFLPYLVVYTLLTASFSWLSIVRFKAGKQDETIKN